MSVSVEVPFERVRVYEFLDVLAHHERFTDHVLTDWRLSGPDRGVGAKAAVVARSGPVRDPIDIEVIEAERPRLSRERNVGAGGRRVATGTYELDDLGAGRTRIRFTYAWQRAPRAERVFAPLVRRVMRRANERALRRLAEQLPAALAEATG